MIVAGCVIVVCVFIVAVLYDVKRPPCNCRPRPAHKSPKPRALRKRRQRLTGRPAAGRLIARSAPFDRALERPRPQR